MTDDYYRKVVYQSKGARRNWRETGRLTVHAAYVDEDKYLTFCQIRAPRRLFQVTRRLELTCATCLSRVRAWSDRTFKDAPPTVADGNEAGTVDESDGTYDHHNINSGPTPPTSGLSNGSDGGGVCVRLVFGKAYPSRGPSESRRQTSRLRYLNASKRFWDLCRARPRPVASGVPVQQSGSASWRLGGVAPDAAVTFSRGGGLDGELPAFHAGGAGSTPAPRILEGGR